MILPRTISRLLWVPILTLVVGVPCISWLFHTPFATTSMMTLVGQGTGIIGAQLFAVVLILNIRHRYIEYFFGGLERLVVVRQYVGFIAFTLLVVHPLVLAVRSVGISAQDILQYFVPINKTLPKMFAIYSAALMLLIVGITSLGIMFSYRALKNAYHFMGFAFFLGVLHMFLVPSTIQTDLVLKYSCLGMAAIGLIAFVYTLVLRKFFTPHYTYTVSCIETIGQHIFEITLSPMGKKITSVPGQFVVVSFVDSQSVSDEEQPFTISGIEDTGEIRIIIRGVDGYRKSLESLQVGNIAHIEGPFGEFYYGYGARSQVWIAGGIGVTPFVRMAEDLYRQETIDYTVDFYYSVHTQVDAVYQELFTAVMQKHPSFVFHLVPSDTTGYVTGEGIVRDVKDVTTRTFFLCAPPSMMAALTESLNMFGVKKKNIYLEKFSLPQ